MNSWKAVQERAMTDPTMLSHSVDNFIAQIAASPPVFIRPPRPFS
jgi:hypothetical protein